MRTNIRLLDCTLRDGGHLNNGVFGENVIKGTTQSLVNANIDIIELGFMWDSKQSKDVTRFYSITDAKKILPEKRGNSKFSVMIEKQNLLDHIEDNDGTIEYIRVIFKRNLIDWAMETVRRLKAKGYKCFMNPVNCTVYSDSEYLELIEKINSVHPYALSIVDTFGVMRIEELVRRYLLVEENLDEDICIGVHLHENLGMAYAMAQKILEIMNPKREIIIDGSLLGMGRDPGNLKLEQISEFINYKYGITYNLTSLYTAITKYIEPIKEKIPWGYSLPYAMSAYYRLHRTYPEYLMRQPELSLSDIDNVLSQIIREESEYYNQSYIENLLRNYKMQTK